MAGMTPAEAAAEATKTLADLELSQNFELAKIGGGEADLTTNVGLAEAGREEQEPRSFKTSQNAAIAHGLASTGLASQAHDNLVNRFAAQRTANQNRLLQGQAGFTREREGVQLKKTLGEHEAASTKTQREAQYAAEHPPVGPAPAAAATTFTPGQYPIPPAQQKAISEGVAPGPGGVVPYESQKVRVGKPPRKSYTPGGK